MGAANGILALCAMSASFLVNRYSPEYALMRSFFWTTVAFFLSFWIANFVWRMAIYPDYFSPIRDIPKPKGGSIIYGGHSREIWKSPPGEMQRKWIDEIENDGLIRYQFGYEYRVMPSSPKALAEVLVHKNYDFVKPARFRTGFGRLLGMGILFAEGDEHKRQRKLLSPAFAFRHIKELYPVFWAKSREATEAMTAEIVENSSRDAPSAVSDIAHWASRTTLDIIGVAGMGRDFNAVQDPHSELNDTYQSIFTPSRAQRILLLLSFFLPQWLLHILPMKRNEQYSKAIKVVREVCTDLIHNKRRQMEKGERTDVDILSVAIESGGFNDEELVNQMMTFLAAGHETTASSMQMAAYHLSTHQDVQNRLREEIRSSLPSIRDTNANITSVEIDRLPYLNAVCNEILRLTPPVPSTARIAVRDTTILGHPIPKDMPIWLVPWAINRSKKIWGDDANDFNPDRWMGPGRANNGGVESNYAFMTFLHGPRSCIGKDFSKAEFACLLAAWVGRFEITLADPNYVLDIRQSITAKPKGMDIRLKVLEGW